MNAKRAPFDNIKVRQALAHTLNRGAIAKAAFLGFVDPVWTPFYDTAQPYFSDENADLYSYDLDRAKQLLEASGVQNLRFTVQTSSSYPELTLATESLQQDLAKIGVTMDIDALDGATWAASWSAGEFQMSASSSAVKSGDPSRTYSAIAPLRADEKNNSYAGEEFFTMARAANAQVDGDARIAAYRDVARFVEKECWILPVANAPRYIGIDNAVDGVTWRGLEGLVTLRETRLSDR